MSGVKEHPYRCVNCARGVAALSVSYSDVGNNVLLKCPHCVTDFADRFIEDTLPVLLVDLILLRISVYRHLLFNRGPKDLHRRQEERYNTTAVLAVLVISLDAYTRCANESSDHPFSQYFVSLACCALETLSLYSSVALSGIYVQALSYWTRSRSSGTFRQRVRDLNLPRLPLAMLYSSIPTLFLLVISCLIWNAEYTRNGNATPSQLTFDRSHHPIFAVVLDSLAKLGRGNLKSGISRGVGNIAGEWINEATLRKVVGGTSALVALSALFGQSKRSVAAALLGAWMLHLALLHTIDPWLS